MDPELSRFASARAARSAQGFTLIELLVVTAILSVLSLGAVIALRPGPGADQSDMERFRTLAETQRALAIEGRMRRGLALGPQGIEVAVRRDGAWQIDGPMIRWRGPVSLTGVPRLSNPDVPEVIFQPDGRSTAFSVGFGRAGRCLSDGWSGVACDSG